MGGGGGYSQGIARGGQLGRGHLCCELPNGAELGSSSGGLSQWSGSTSRESVRGQRYGRGFKQQLESSLCRRHSVAGSAPAPGPAFSDKDERLVLK